jgi:AcrR family transcriptional regulator
MIQNYGVEVKTADRKIQIINTTLFIIGESGLQGLTTAKIAAMSKITEAAIYRHFSGKDDIVLQTIDAIGKRLSSTLLSVKEETIEAPEKLSKIFRTHLDHIQKNRGIPRIVYTSEVHLDEKMRAKLFEIIEFYLRTIKSILEEGVISEKFKKDLDVNAEARRFLSMIQFTAFRYSLSGFNKDTIDEGLTLWNSFLKSL